MAMPESDSQSFGPPQPGGAITTLLTRLRCSAVTMWLVLGAVLTLGMAQASSSTAGRDPPNAAEQRLLFDAMAARIDGMQEEFEREKQRSRGLEGEVRRLRASVDTLEQQQHPEQQREGCATCAPSTDGGAARRRLSGEDDHGEVQIIHKRRINPAAVAPSSSSAGPSSTGHRHRAQAAEVCTQAEVPRRVGAISDGCCDETTESCSGGQVHHPRPAPPSTSAPCVVWPFPPSFLVICMGVRVTRA
jgi:hypothetical protein